MHDEAAPAYADMIDQTTLGHRLILQQFNVTPKTTWQIDPFGHSTFQASMMSAPIAGFNGVHVARDDWQEQNQRTADRTIEMVWAPSTSLGMAGATYMGVLYNGYGRLRSLSR
jgi:alpha-mannosidase